MIVAIIIFTTTLFAVGAIMLAIIHRKRNLGLAERRGGWRKYIVYVGFIYLILIVAFVGRNCLALLLTVVVLGGGIEIYRNTNSSNSGWLAATALTTGMIVCFGHLMMSHSNSWLHEFVFLFLLVAVTDSFSQLWGRLTGHRRLCPSISPNKTLAGFLGGTVTAMIAAISLRFLKTGTSTHELAFIGLVIALAATSGDLLFSAIKRHLKIKDFSGLLPGHGGLLDRFDSLLVAGPVYFWTNRMLLN